MNVIPLARFGSFALLILPASVACGSSDGEAETVDATEEGVLPDDATGPEDSGESEGPAEDAASSDEVSEVFEEENAGGPEAEDGAFEVEGSARTGCIAASGLEVYWGNLHAHTAFSDGEQEPADAFAYARRTAGLDVLVVTDHLEQIYLPTRWSDCKEQADAADEPGAFVAACGYEYGSGFDALFRSTGHNNVFANPDLFPAVQLDFHDFYASLAACPDCIGQFNHPGSEGVQHWNHFEYHADVDERMNLYEFNSDPAWEMYFEALDAGWHVSPVWNQDNHSADWGTANDHRSGFWLSSLTRAGLYEAFRARRTFASGDRNAWVRVMADGDCWMGSDLRGVPPNVELLVEAGDSDPTDSFRAVELWGPGRTLLDNADCGGGSSCAVTFVVEVSGPTYAVARLYQDDGEFLVAAPVWLAP